MMTAKVVLKRKRANRRKAIIARREPNDLGSLGTEGRCERGDVVVLEDLPQSGGRRARVRTQTMMDRYRLRDQITERQFDAGERLLAWWRAAGGGGLSISNYGARIPGGSEISEHQALLRCDLNTALRVIGQRLASVVIHVCLCDEAAGDWGERHRGKSGDGIAILRLALDSLADHWGFPL